MRNIIFVGDPIEDLYCNSRNHDVTNVVPGGAYNTFYNARSMLRETEYKSNVKFIPDFNFLQKPIYKVLRIDDLPDIHVFEHKTNHYSELRYTIQKQLNDLLDVSSYNSVIVLSDYNKGTLNIPIVRYRGINKVELAIVDSKYSSLHQTFFDFANNYILRCTGDEYLPEFAQKFNYTIWTDGPNEIKLLDKQQNIIKKYKVPTLKAVDTCGAGDTFTSAIAVYFYANGFKYENIDPAIHFAISASLDVILKKQTAITQITI